MSIRTVEVPVVAMTAESFAPCGEVFGLRDSAEPRAYLPTGFAHEGKITIGTIWDQPGELEFSKLERHYNVKQSFVQLSGAPSVVCAAPATDLNDPLAFPKPEDLIGYLIQPGQGYMYHPGVWHALNRCVLSAPGANFLIINVAPNPTDIVDFANGDCAHHVDLGVTKKPQPLAWTNSEYCQFRIKL